MVYSSRDLDPKDDFSKDSELWLLDLDSSEQKQITNNDQADYYASFSPDDTEIIFMQTRERYMGSLPCGRAQKSVRGILRIFDLEEWSEYSIFDEKYDYRKPVYSPDGEYIATGIEHPGKCTRFAIFDRDGGLLFTHGSDFEWCSWYTFSPDTEIAVIRCKSSSTKVYSQLSVVEIYNGFYTYQLTPKELYVQSFDVSPDGNTVFFSAKDNKLKTEFRDNEIFRIEFDGTQLTRLTDNDFADFDIVVSPFISDETDNQ